MTLVAGTRLGSREILSTPGGVSRLHTVPSRLRPRRLRLCLLVPVLALLMTACGETPTPTQPTPPATAQHGLTLSVSPASAGTIATIPDQSQYGHGTSVTLVAKPATGYRFIRWEGALAGSSNPATVVMDSDMAIAAVFAADTAAQYTLALTVFPSNVGTVARDPDQAQYPSGTIVALTAMPGPGYQFVRWEGDLAGSTNPATVVMNGNKIVSALLTPTTATQYTLAVAVSPSNGGTVARSPSQTVYAQGTPVTLTATPVAGYQFARWEGDVTGSSNPVTVIMNANRAVTAVFTSTTGTHYTLTVTASPSNAGTVARAPSQAEYDPGATVTLTATPGPGYQFARWEGGLTGSANPTTVVMNANVSVSAVFTTIAVPAVVASTPSRATGTFVLSVSYSWGPNPTGQDWLELEEAAGSSAFVKIAETPPGDHASPWTVTLTKPAGSYLYRARAHLGATSAYSDYSVAAAVNVLPPDTITVFASFDNAVRSSSADPALANTVYSSGEIGAGWDFVFDVLASYASKGTGSALKFDVQSQIAGRGIASATLRLYVSAPRGDSMVAPEIQVNAFSGDWNPGTITWNAWTGLPYYFLGEARRPAPATAGQALDFDVTTIVQNWASGAFNNYGLRLAVTASYPGHTPSLGTTSFQSLETSSDPNQRPQLIVNFR